MRITAIHVLEINVRPYPDRDVEKSKLAAKSGVLTQKCTALDAGLEEVVDDVARQRPNLGILVRILRPFLLDGFQDRSLDAQESARHLGSAQPSILRYARLKMHGIAALLPFHWIDAAGDRIIRLYQLDSRRRRPA